ncbi:gamma carbonic anhydrase family protein [Anaerovibrio sp.]|uniref:gamma carbonic anhydrase family protein n=1 Tax=Anaerovibrio sp. TaxID=1872532 RepID=UPI003F1676FC
MAIYPYKDINPDLADDVFIAPSASVVGDVKMGSGTNVWFGAVVRGDVNKVIIGEHTNIQDNATIHTMSDAPTEIGDHVTIGHNAVVHCSKVGSNCLIGMGSVLIGYSEIGDNCVIGANSFIPQHKKIPAGSLVYGNPAKLVRALRDDELEALKASTENYYKLGQVYAEIMGNK